MRLAALLSGIVTCLILLAIIATLGLLPFTWGNDFISTLSSATRKQSLFLSVWLLAFGLCGAGIGYLTWQYFRMLLGHRSIVKTAVWAGLAVFGLSFAASAHSGASQFSSPDGFFSFLFAALFGGTLIANCLWLKGFRTAHSAGAR